MIGVIVKVINPEDQRYRTVGDWINDPDTGTTTVLVSSLDDWRKEALVALHELVEAILCRHDQITTKEVDQFDMVFEAAREEGNTDEPGDCSLAPYYKQHQIATAIERLLAAELDVDWTEYEEAIRKAENEYTDNRQ